MFNSTKPLAKNAVIIHTIRKFPDFPKVSLYQLVKPFKLALTLVFVLMVTTVFTSVQAAQWRKTSGFEDRDRLINYLNSMVNVNRNVGGFAQTAGGKWLLSYDNHVYASAGFSSQLFNAVKNYVNAGHKVVGADCNDKGGCIVIYENWGHHRIGSIPSSLISRISKFQNKGWQIRGVEVTNSGYVLLGPGNVVGWSGTKNGLGKALKDTHKADRTIRDLSVGFNNEWAFIAGHNPMYKDISISLINKLNTIAQSSERLRNITIARNNGYFVYTHGSEASNSNSPIAEIEWRLGPNRSTNIWKRMAKLGIPGASIALIEPGAQNPEISFTRGYGLKKQGETGGSVLTSTPFSLASLSKYLGAVTALSYAWDNGISLNQDIFSQVGPGQLSVWRDIGNDNSTNDYYGIPNNNLSGGISLRRLLSHTAGFPKRGVQRINVKHFDLAAEQPTIWWLLGLQCSGTGDVCTLPGTNYVWQVAAAGTQYDYSNDGYMVVQAFLEDINDEDIHTILKNHLFTPLSMSSANSRIDKSSSYLDKSAWHHGNSGPAADWTAHAHILASNIYSSSADYAKAMIVALNDGISADNEAILPYDYVDTLLSRQNYDNNQKSAPYGFGVNLDNSATEYSDQDFFHGGSFTDRVRTFMCGNPTRNQGIVVLLNSGSDNAGVLINEIRKAYIDAVGWPNDVTCN